MLVRLFQLCRLIYWLIFVLLILWIVRLLTRNRPAPLPTATFVDLQKFLTREARTDDDAKPSDRNGPQSRGEREARDTLEALFGRPFNKDRRAFVNPVTGRHLELDGVNYDLRLAFEYNGKHHYQDIKQAQRDVIKRRLCDERNVYLIPIPYSVRNIRKHVASLLPTTLDPYLADDGARRYVRESRQALDRK